MKYVLFSFSLVFSQLLSAQNVGIGIGTTAPSYKLQVHGTKSEVSVGLTTDATGTTGENGVRLWLSDNNFSLINNQSTGSINLNTNGSDRLTVLANGNIGIGTILPKARLHIADSSVVFAAANQDIFAGNVPVSGAGKRMMWYVNKAAFRVGAVAGNNWDNDSIGAYSVATGYNSRASGYYCVAMGYNAIASAYLGSIAIGGSTTATGQGAVSLGTATIASAAGATAIGESNVASGSNATALGKGAVASGISSFSSGKSTSAIGEGSIAMGESSVATGNYSVAIGHNSTSPGNSSIAMGNTCHADGESSTALGTFTNASGFYSTALGYAVEASGINSTAIGYHTTASYNNTTALGSYTTANGFNSTALGFAVNTNGFDGCLIIGDNTGVAATPSICYRANEFRARFDGGYAFYSSANAGSGVYMVHGDNAWSAISDSTKKCNFLKTDGEYVLSSISRMRIGSWNYKTQYPKQFRHYGPMAQEFHSAFGHDAFGKIGSDTLINSADIDGIMMISIQALEKRTAVIEKLQTANNKLQEQVADLTNALVEIKKQFQMFAINEGTSSSKKD